MMKKALTVTNICLLLLVIFLGSTCTPTKIGSGSGDDGDHKYTNKLITQNSPYLLQHAHNPVNWYPWGEEALAKAKAENKMLIISVGYAACHWCHVMEDESFEDSTVAAIMNEHFVAIKIDREERPDIDDIYMTACQLASGKSCGWPLNAFALPDGRPFWAGTYFPKDQWQKVLSYFISERAKNPSKVEDWANDVTNGIRSLENLSMNPAPEEFTMDKLKTITSKFLDNVDFKKGGKKVSVKFPLPNNYQYLLRQYTLNEDKKALQAVEVTLNNMANGGIYDHLAGGFARYATDEDWKVPHFEKMLYDNGQLVSLYAEAYRATKNPLYKKVVYDILNFVQQNLTSPKGGFYSSLDADSEGEEGKFYVWTKAEVDAIITDTKKADIFNITYNITTKGNWENGKNILHKTKSNAELAKLFQLSETALETILDECKVQLLAERNKRVRPGLDDKVLASWNALMLKGYVDAYRTFNDPQFLTIATKNANFLVKEMMQKDNRLERNYKDGRTSINAFLDDYALAIDAFVALYQASFDETWLYKAKGLSDYVIQHFYDAKTGMFYYTSDLDPPLVTRKKEIADNVIPSSNSVLAKNLHYLGLYYFNDDYINKSKTMLNNMINTVIDAEQPSFYSNWCTLLTDFVHQPFEVAIVGSDYGNIRQEMDEHFIPNMVLLGGKKEGTLELLDGKLIDGETTIYVCKDKVCKLPVNTVKDALELMEEEW